MHSDQQPQLAYCPNCGDPEHRKPTATCDLEAMTPGAAAYVDAMRRVGSDQDVADAEAAARRQSPLPPRAVRYWLDVEGVEDYADVTATVENLIAENERLREIVDAYDNANLAHDCDLEGYDDNCAECIAVRLMLAWRVIGQ